MKTPYWSDAAAEVFLREARQVLAELPEASADCIVTSPPYHGLRDYGAADQIGQEETPAAYVEALRQVFDQARRVLTADGTLWLNLGDRYAANSDGSCRGGGFHRRQPPVRPRSRQVLPPKNLMGMPWRVAFALQDDGWILRNAIVWHKPNAMPQSVTGRLPNRYELVFLLVKQRHYWFDLDSLRQPCANDRPEPGHAPRSGHVPNAACILRPSRGKYADPGERCAGRRHGERMLPGRRHDSVHRNGKNPGDVWHIPTRPLRAAHFAPFPGRHPAALHRRRLPPRRQRPGPFCRSRNHRSCRAAARTALHRHRTRPRLLRPDRPPSGRCRWPRPAAGGTR